MAHLDFLTTGKLVKIVDGKSWEVVVEPDIPKVLQQIHDKNGHLGINKTYQMVFLCLID